MIYIQLLRLSASTQDLPKSVICNVLGVNPKFLKIGEKIAAERGVGQKAFAKWAHCFWERWYGQRDTRS